jgi:hypothetical protein
MSFLNNNNAEFLSARITQKGRNAIASGNFTINYFQIGDSEYDYTTPFDSFNGLNGVPYQKVFSPFDKESGVKYPYTFDSSTSGTTYGVPINNQITEPIRNVMGPAGYISDYKDFDNVSLPVDGTTIYCPVQQLNASGFSETRDYITVLTGFTFQNCKYITLVVGNTFVGSDPTRKIVTGNSISYVYKITNIVGNNIYVDRNVPELDYLPSNTKFQVICNSCEVEYPLSTVTSPACLPSPIPSGEQLNPWTMNIVWGDKPIGSDTNGTSQSLYEYGSNIHMSTKSLLGYTTSSGQTFDTFNRTPLTNPTSYVNTLGEMINVPPEEQRTIAIIHYSKLGDIVNDPERFYKYDDYISTDTSTVDSIVTDMDGNSLSDMEYFELYIPFIYYHRYTGNTIGAKFIIDKNDDEQPYFINSSINEKHQITFYYLTDENLNRVGKVFPHNKTIVIDDQELVAMLDYKSNRRFTLPAPKLGLTPSNDLPGNSIFDGTTGKTAWVTYNFINNSDNITNTYNNLPCNYFTKIESTTTPSNVLITFGANEFANMVTAFTQTISGYVVTSFQVLLQITNTGELPTNDNWKTIDMYNQLGGTSAFTSPDINSNTFLIPTNIIGKTFTIKKLDLGSVYDITTYRDDFQNTVSPATQFGDEQPFPGSVRFVRSTDVESMRFMVNLPSSQFTTTQNPTYTNGKTKKITEIALLNNNKEVMVIGKTASPVTRSGTQVFGIKLDF